MYSVILCSNPLIIEISGISASIERLIVRGVLNSIISSFLVTTLSMVKVSTSPAEITLLILMPESPLNRLQTKPTRLFGNFISEHSVRICSSVV